MEAYINEKKIEQEYDKLEERLNSIKISGSYDELRRNIVERFIEYGRDDIREAQYERSIYTINCLNDIIDVMGEDDIRDIYTYKTHTPKIDKFSVCDDSGRPVFYLGYVGFEGVRKDLENMTKFGSNTISVELGPSDMIFPKGMHESWNVDDSKFTEGGEKYCFTEDEFEINLFKVKKDIIPILERAEKSNVSVALLISPHYFPDWMFEVYPDLRCNTGGFLPYNIYHPVAKKMLKIYIKALIPLIKDYKSMRSICLTNEPTFNTGLAQQRELGAVHDLLPTLLDTGKGGGTTVMGDWHEYLENEFKTLDNLNKTLGTSFKAFTEIPLMTEDNKTPLYYVWTLWNNRLFSDWHRWLAELIRDIAPEIPLCAKIMPIYGTSEMPYHRDFISHGTDPEEFAEFLDISGNDAWGFLGRDHLPLSYKLSWYDYLASMKKMPIYNGEDHIIEDREKDYSPTQAKRIYADMWQGAIHGRTATDIWLWERGNDPRFVSYGSILHRPDCVEAVARACLDLNRLTYEATAMQNEKPQVAILYSKPTRIYETEYVADMFKAYEAAIFSGNKVQFVNDNKVEQIHDYKLVVVPGVTATFDKVRAELLKFLENGGKLLITARNEDSLQKTEYNVDADKDIVKRIYEKACVVSGDNSKISPCREYSNMLAKEIFNIMKLEINVLSDDFYNVEWFAGNYENSTLINVCNHNLYSITIKVNDGTKVKDLISQKVYEGNFELKSYECMLLEVLK